MIIRQHEHFVASFLWAWAWAWASAEPGDATAAAYPPRSSLTTFPHHTLSALESSTPWNVLIDTSVLWLRFCSRDVRAL